MIDIELPNTNNAVDSITFNDAWIDPDYYIDRSLDPSYYNNEHMPVMRLQEPYYNTEKYKRMLEIKEEAKKRYEEWISNAPWFVKVKIK